MSADNVLSMVDAAARSQTYGRLARAFQYPETGVSSVLSGADYTQAFDRSATKGACSLRGYAYQSEVHPTAVYEELLRFYQFFGLGRAADANLPDHICVELEFMQFLSELEQQVQRRGESCEPLWRAQRDFLDRHLSVLTAGMQKKLKSDSPACRALVDACAELVAEELQRLEELVGKWAA